MPATQHPCGFRSVRVRFLFPQITDATIRTHHYSAKIMDKLPKPLHGMQPMPYAKRVSRKFEGKSYRQVEWHLRDRQMPEDLIQKTLATLREERAEGKRDKLRQQALRKAWGELLEALRHERQSVRSMARYKTVEPSPEREEFIAAYLAALDRVYGRIVTLKREGSMPEHNHWTDYVPEKIKDAFMVEADGIPARHKARMKQPFARTLPFALFDRRKGRLLRKTYAELKTATEHNDEAKVSKIKEALARIHELPDGADVPNTWHGMLKDWGES